jgi:hypothetical protein
LPDSNYSSITSSNAIINSYPSTILNFLNHLPAWGGKIELESTHSLFSSFSTLPKYSISNTCSIDYLLFCVWTATKLNDEIVDILQNHFVDNSLNSLVKKIIANIEENKWNAAKSLWIIDGCKLTPTRRVFDCMDSEYDIVVKHLDFYQQYELKCDDMSCSLFDVKVETRKELFFERDENENIDFYFASKHKCSSCSSCLIKSFIQTPPWLFISVIYKYSKETISHQEFPKTITMNQRKYSLLCSTIVSQRVKDHFCAIFELYDKKFLIDDLNSSYSENIPDINRVCTCFYYLSK